MASPARDARQFIEQLYPGAVPAQSPTMIANGEPARGRGYLNMQIAPNRFISQNGIGDIGWHMEDGTEVDTAWIDAIPEDSPYIKRMVLADYHAYFGNGNLQFDSAYPFRYSNPITGDWLQWQPMPNLQWSNDLNSVANIGQTKQAIVAQLQRDDTYFFPGVYGTGFDFYLELQTTRLQKRLLIDSISILGSPPQFIIDGGNPVAIMSFQFQRSPGVTIWLDGTQWTEGNGQSNARSSVNYVEFRASNGSTLWYMSPSISWDLLGNQYISPIRFRRSGASYIIELRIPWSWLETAVYPITIDPTVNAIVSAGNDDGRQYDIGSNAELTDNSTFIRATPGGGYYVYAAGRMAVTGPASGDNVNEAYGTVFVSTTTIDVNVDLEDADSAAALTTGLNNITNRTLTGNSVRLTSTGSAFRNVSTPSMIAAIQAVIDRIGWASGNYILMRLQGASSTGGAVWFYENSSSSCFRFYIDYSTGATIVTGQATLSGSSDLDGDSLNIVNSDANLSGSASIPGDSLINVFGNGELLGLSDLSGDSLINVFGNGELLGDSNLLADSLINVLGNGELLGLSDLLGDSLNIISSEANLSGSSILSGSSFLIIPSNGLFSGVAIFTGDGIIVGQAPIVIGEANLIGNSNFYGSGNIIVLGEVTLSGLATLTGLGSLTVFGSSNLVGSGDIDGIAKAIVKSIGSLVANGILQASGRVIDIDLITPDNRVYHIKLEIRSNLIESENRINIINVEERIIKL